MYCVNKAHESDGCKKNEKFVINLLTFVGINDIIILASGKT